MKPQKRLTLVQDLIVWFVLNPGGFQEHATKAACGLDPEISPLILLEAYVKAQMHLLSKILKLQSPGCLKERNFLMAKLEILQKYCTQLFALETPGEFGSDPALADESIILPNGVKGAIRLLSMKDFTNVCRLLAHVSVMDKSSLRFSDTPEALTALFNWYNELPSDFPVLVVELENGRLAAMGTAFRGHGPLANVGTFALGVDDEYRGLGLRETLLKKLVTIAPQYVRALTGYVTASQQSELRTYRGLGFTETHVGICLPDGEGEREPLILLALDLATDEEYTGACD